MDDDQLDGQPDTPEERRVDPGAQRSGLALEPRAAPPGAPGDSSLRALRRVRIVLGLIAIAVILTAILLGIPAKAH